MVCSFVQNALTKQIPQFLESLSVPANVEGFSKLTPDELIKLAYVLVPTVLVLLGFRSIVSLLFAAPSKPTRVNNKIDLGNAKVANVVPIPEAMAKAEQNDGKVVFCRCWKSKTFPFCDGSHVKHNKETGDNVGPLVLKK
eukprot:Rhum_TRINITY_DN6475_c0_g1::Rhum_TRINITY_DN6475_c0_g1_i1::g.20212::m.20212